MNAAAPIILLVDDHEANRYLLARMLVSGGFRVEQAATGAEAFRHLAATSFDAVICDVRLPDISGYDVLKRIKQSPLSAEIPVLLISAYFSETELGGGGLQGSEADAYLPSPIQTPVLLASVRALLRAAQAERATRRAERQLREAHDRLGAVLNRPGILLYTCDLELRYTWFRKPHPCFRTEDLLGHTDEEIADREDVAEVIAFKQDALAAGGVLQRRIACRVGGQWLFYEMAAEPLRDDQGRISGMSVIAMECTESVRTEKALEQNQRILSAAMDAAGMGAWQYNFADHVCEYGPLAREFYGLQSPRFVHDEEGVRALIHPDDIPAMWSAVQAASDPAGDGRYHAEYRVRRPEGGWRWLSVWGLVQFEGEGAGRKPVRMMGASRDVTCQKETEAEKERLAYQRQIELDAARRLQAISTQMIQANNVESLYERILDTAVAILRADFASFQLLEANRGDCAELRLLGHRGLSPEAAQFWERVRLGSRSTCGEALRTGQRIFVPDVLACDWMAGTDDLATYLQSGVRAVQTTPLVARSGTLLGMISTHWRQPHQATADELRTLDVLARLAADLIDRAQAERALRKSEEKYRSLFDNMSEGFAIGEAICRPDGTPDDFAFLEMNQAFERQSGLTRDILNKPMRQVLPNLEQHWIDRYGAVALGGEPLHFDAPNRDTDRHYEVFCYSPGRGRFAIIFTDITQRKRAEQALARSEEQLRLALDASEMGIWTYDPATDTLIWSEKVRAAFGLNPAEPVSYDLFINRLLHPDDRQRVAQAVERSLAEKSDYDVEYRVVWPDGSIHWVAARGRGFYDDEGRILRMLGIAQDITGRKRAEEELNAAKTTAEQARAAAEKASRAKDRFLAVLSHELRTPLMPVVMTASLLARRQDLPPEVQSDLQIVLRNAQMEARLIDDLLDLTRIARGKMQFDFQPVDVHLVIRAAADVCSQGDGAPIILHLQAQRHWVRADAARLQQVLWNLLNNARKFTPATGRVTVHSTTTDAGDLRVEVSDTGAGIDPAVLPRLFSPFEQGDSGEGRRLGGLGLGLAISRGIVHAHGGSISARSDGRGTGATFTIRLSTVPAFDGGAEAPPAERPAPHAASGRPLRILLVEDHESTRNILRKLISALGHQVYAAASVEAAKEIALREKFDLVVSDLGLPDGTGHELMIWLRQREGLAGIALSGYGMEDDIRRSREAGFAEHLTKPLNMDQFEAAIHRVVGNRS